MVKCCPFSVSSYCFKYVFIFYLPNAFQLDFPLVPLIWTLIGVKGDCYCNVDQCTQGIPKGQSHFVFDREGLITYAWLGREVMEGVSCSEGRGFESLHGILDGHDLFHIDLL